MIKFFLNLINQKTGESDQRPVEYQEVKQMIRAARDNGDSWHMSPRSLAENDDTIWLQIDKGGDR